MRRLLGFLDPLLGRAPLIIEAHYRPAGQAQVRDDKADSREQFPEIVNCPGRGARAGSPFSMRLGSFFLGCANIC
jgi:hypothetical protein